MAKASESQFYAAIGNLIVTCYASVWFGGWRKRFGAVFLGEMDFVV